MNKYIPVEIRLLKTKKKTFFLHLDNEDEVPMFNLIGPGEGFGRVSKDDFTSGLRGWKDNRILTLDKW